MLYDTKTGGVVTTAQTGTQKKARCPVCGSIVPIVEHNRGMTEVYTGYDYHHYPAEREDGLLVMCDGSGREYHAS